MAFSGTLVQSGSAVGVVVETGNTTEIGKINQALQSVEQQTTPLIKKINRLNKQIFQGILCLSLFLVILRHFDMVWIGISFFRLRLLWWCQWYPKDCQLF